MTGKRRLRRRRTYRPRNRNTSCVLAAIFETKRLNKYADTVLPLLRRFRDKTLNTSNYGRLFVREYYRVSRLIILSTLICVLSGCTALGIANLLLDDDHLHSGRVEAVTQFPMLDQTFVLFESGDAYQCHRDTTLNIGDWVDVKEMSDGSCDFSADVKNNPGKNTYKPFYPIRFPYTDFDGRPL